MAAKPRPPPRTTTLEEAQSWVSATCDWITVLEYNEGIHSRCTFYDEKQKVKFTAPIGTILVVIERYPEYVPDYDTIGCWTGSAAKGQLERKERMERLQ